MKRRLGWIPDVPDGRDYLLAARPGLSLPRAVDHIPHDSPVEDQGMTSSCVGQTLIACAEYLDRLRFGKHSDLSRLMAYFGARRLSGLERVDAGAYIRDGIKAMARWGACDETIWPFLPSLVNEMPSTAAYRDGRANRIGPYYRASGLYEARVALAAGYPVAFGAALYESFFDGPAARTGVVPMPRRGERMVGGHAMKLSGYDDDKLWAPAKNSWGANWGREGYALIPYEYIRLHCDDFWVITAMNDQRIEIPEGSIYLPLLGIINWIRRLFAAKKEENK